ncbi:MAG TPA: hypothetical protein PKB00_07565 [Microthrixaceae bacterium]|nr:hypothetical protein [Microthrixaceae bacterium]HNE37251.1 hypothetical protein [Microthrixaceae bacterium]HNH94925.1 hypothetical protein [Microthrixaceae bacterium]
MSDFVFNIAKGRVAELFNRVDSNDPTNSAIIVVPVDRGAATDATLKDLDTLSAVLGSVTERTTGGWTRKTLTDADLAAIAVDDTNDRMPATIPAVLWSAVTAGAVTDLVFCYDSDTTSGTDANIVPLVMSAFPITPDGSDVQANAGDIFRAS